MTMNKKTQMIIVAVSMGTIALSSLFFGIRIGMSYAEIGHSDIPTSSPPVNQDRPHPISKARIRGDSSSKQRPSAQRIEDQFEPKRSAQTSDSSVKPAKTLLEGGAKPAKPNVSGEGAGIRGDDSSKQRPSAQRIEEDRIKPNRSAQNSDRSVKPANTNLEGRAKHNLPAKGGESKIPFFFVQSVSNVQVFRLGIT